MEQQVKLTLNFLQRLADLHWLCASPRYTRGSCIPVAAFADPSSEEAQQGLHTLWYFLWLYAEPLPNMLLAWWGLTGTLSPGPTNCAVASSTISDTRGCEKDGAKLMQSGLEVAALLNVSCPTKYNPESRIYALHSFAFYCGEKKARSSTGCNFNRSFQPVLTFTKSC